MYKKILVSSVVATLLIFSGCGTDSEGEQRLSTQHMLDKGDYTGVINTLESKINKSDGENFKLASAYMGVAGLSFVDIITMMGDIEEEEDHNEVIYLGPSLVDYNNSNDDNDENDNNSFAQFAEKIKENAEKTPKVLENLQKAIEAYKRIREGKPSNEKYTNVSLFLGLSYIAKATTALSHLGDIGAMIEENPSESETNELLAYGCAITSVYGNKYDQETCSSVTSSEVFNIENINGNIITYGSVEITMPDGSVVQKLTNSDRDEVILTSGYCDVSNNKSSSYVDGYYPCPVGDGTLVISDVLEETINEGFEVIIDVAPDDVKEDIVEYKEEIGVDDTGRITIYNIVDYINKQFN